jgi:hypothetical protein
MYLNLDSPYTDLRPRRFYPQYLRLAGSIQK